jgi:hypothetical protein
MILRHNLELRSKQQKRIQKWFFATICVVAAAGLAWLLT